jgi:hypothetical protein
MKTIEEQELLRSDEDGARSIPLGKIINQVLSSGKYPNVERKLQDIYMNDFIEIVRKMRAAQKGFFKSDQNSKERRQFLDESRKLEKQVDDLLASTKQTPPAQHPLF